MCSVNANQLDLLFRCSCAFIFCLSKLTLILQCPPLQPLIGNKRQIRDCIIIMIKDEKFDNFSLGHSGIMKNMASWRQQSATAWTELYKEFAANSQKMSESWSDALWKTWTSKESLQSRENVSLRDNNTTKKNNKMRVLVLQGGGAIGAFQAGAFKALYEKITKEDKENGNDGRPLFDIIAGKIGRAHV